ncbi:MAG: hypothetical protein FWC19_07825 [Treponema sp.]|nr:hypothetical protein [Treponema sp.]MCL2272690.1 hypothetical protein [Treponema sp.]
MSNEPEWRDANPQPENLPGKGRTIILFVLGGIAIFALTIIGIRIRPVGLAAGIFAFFSGIMMLLRRHRYNFKRSLIITACGFLLLLANPRFGIVAGFASYFLIVGAIGIVVFGLVKAIKLAWDIGKW